MTDFQRPDQSPSQDLWTYKDTVDHLLDFLRGTSDAQAVRDCRRAAVEGLREIVNVRSWMFYYSWERITTKANYVTGTIEYDHTGNGSGERVVLLTDGTFPSWAADGTISISNVAYPVRNRIGDTTVQLDIDANPGADVASGTSYVLYQEEYPLPIDFLKMASDLLDSNNNRILRYVAPKHWLQDQRWSVTPSQPFQFSILSASRYQGRKAVAFAPSPNDARRYDYIMVRKARELRVEDYNTGSVSVTADSTAVTGSGTVFTSDHVGAVIRLSSSTTEAPTSRYGSNPYDQERVITAVTSGTAATVDVAFDTTRSGVKYYISDPVDIEQQVMRNAYLRTCEKVLANFRHFQDRAPILGAWKYELQEAMAADSAFKGGRVAGNNRGVGYIDALLEQAELGNNID